MPNGSSFQRSLKEKIKLADAFKNYKVEYPEQRGHLLDVLTKEDCIMHNIALHGKLHYGEFAYGFITPLIEHLESTLEGQAAPQYVAA